MMSCDSRQISRALTNVLKNAAESIDGRLASGTSKMDKGWIRVTLMEETRSSAVDVFDEFRIVVEDNGRGLPEDRERLTEPYMTTRGKGTGLGLAIVRKIMEDHQGVVLLNNRDGGGAVVTLSLARERDDMGAPAKSAF
jgi:two-component system nitrogen regulation sensor histidine kinase NtrY